MKDIFLKNPYLSPKISIKNDYKLIGKSVFKKWTLTPTYRVIESSYYIHNLEELREFESFFSSKKGRFASFFLPSFTQDFTIKEKSAKGDLFIHVQKANRSYWIFEQQRFIYIPDLDFATKIIDIKSSDEKETLILENALPGELSLGAKILELINVRFNSDKIEFRKKGASGYTVELSFREVFYE